MLGLKEHPVSIRQKPKDHCQGSSNNVGADVVCKQALEPKQVSAHSQRSEDYADSDEIYNRVDGYPFNSFRAALPIPKSPSTVRNVGESDAQD